MGHYEYDTGRSPATSGGNRRKIARLKERIEELEERIDELENND